MKFTTAFLTAAHAAAKQIADATLSYAQKLGRAMKAAYATLKQAATTMRTTTLLELPATILLEEGGLLFGFLYLEHLRRNSYFFATAPGLDPNAKVSLVVDGVSYQQNDYLATDLKAASRQPDVAAAISQTLRTYRLNEALIAKLAGLVA